MSPQISSSPVSKQLPNVRTVRIHAVTGHPLNLLEVEIYSNETNVAIGKTATQSSTLNTMDASKAIDGKTKTFSHTTGESTFSWWQVDLETSFPVESIKILNRWCRNVSDPMGCLCRLSHAVVTFFDGEGQWISTASVGNTCGKLDWTYSFSNDDPRICSWNQFD